MTNKILPIIMMMLMLVTSGFALTFNFDSSPLTADLNLYFYNKTASDARYLQSESDPAYYSNPLGYYNSTTLPETDFGNYYNKSQVDALLLAIDVDL
jgi:hypothetical protein